MNVWDEKWGHLTKVKLDFTSRRIFAEILKTTSFEGKSVLELGCGTGRLSFLALAGGARCVTLVDSSAKALEFAREMLAGEKNVEIVRSDIFKFPSDRKFDLVLSSGLVEHFKGKELDRLLEIHRNAAKEKVLILVPASPHWNDIRMRLSKCEHEFGWQRPFTRGRLRHALIRNGLQPQFIRRFFVTYGMKNLPLRRKFEKALAPFESFIGGLLLAICTPKANIH